MDQADTSVGRQFNSRETFRAQFLQFARKGGCKKKTDVVEGKDKNVRKV